MANVVIKQVPDGCRDKVKYMAMIAIERFLRGQNVTPLIEDQELLVKTEMDAIKAANSIGEGEPDAS